MREVQLYIVTDVISDTAEALSRESLVAPQDTSNISVGDIIFFPDLNLKSVIEQITSSRIWIADDFLTEREIFKYEIGGVASRVDLFKDEQISITQSIQNVRDIEKVFTSFSKTFNLPASQTNNKIFKHYYDFDIVGGFDARFKQNAIIEINNQPFKKGKIKLEGVNIKNGKPHTYKITFFGNIVKLKDKLGEKKLSDLELTQYDLPYNAQEVKRRLSDRRETSSTHVIAPLITQSQRLYYDSGSHDEAGDGNLYYDTGHTQNLHGVKWDELKYAIRVNKIIEAIESTFGLKFSNDFFKNTSIEEFDHLFLWLHRKSGKVEDLSGGTKVDSLVKGFEPIRSTGPIYNRGDNVSALVFPEDMNTWKVRLEPTDLTKIYTVTIRDTANNNLYTKTNHVGNLTIDCIALGIYEYGVRYYLWIESSEVVTFSNIRWSINWTDYFTNIPYSAQFNTGAYSTSIDFTFNISRQMPNLKIIDFLTGLFKTFNLTAYEEEGEIVVKTLNDYYSDFNTYNIDEYVDASKSTVNVALPYKEIIFKFKDTKYFLANKYSELENKDFGELNYNDNTNDFVGNLYKIEVPFGHMLYENITNPATQTTTDIQWGYSVNDSQNAYLGSPLLFYPKWKGFPFNISFVNEMDSTGKPISHIPIGQANIPLNSVSTTSGFNPFNFNFSLETSEYTGNTTFNETLFEKYYKDYIKSVFNPKQRITKITAYLPLKILSKITPADRLIFEENKYKINSMKTDLITGKTELELLNDL